MTSFREIRNSFIKTDAFLLTQETNARSASLKARWAGFRRYNAHAYFVMLFAQLEQDIDNKCAALVATKKSAAKWRSRRPWDSVDLGRMDFMRKVALLTDKGQVAYAQIRDYYKTRCQIAHGESALVGVILLPAVSRDLQALAKALKAA